MTFPSPTPIPGHQGQPNSAAPLQALFEKSRAGLSSDGHYIVLPAALTEQLPLPVQVQLAHCLAQLQQDSAAAGVSWPVYEVQAMRHAAVRELSEGKLREAGITPDIDDDGELVHRRIATGDTVLEDEQVLISYPDPLQPAAGRSGT